MSTVEQYGYFDKSDRCFVLLNDPPKKWMNLHYNKPGDDEVYAECSNIGDGSITLRDKVGNTCNLVSYDSKYLYVRDDETNVTFNPWGEPCPREVTDRSCRYYAEKTVISGTCEGLKVVQRVFVPRNEVAEVWTVHIENLSNRPRRVSVFGFAKFLLSGCDAEGKGFHGGMNVGDVYPELGGVYVENRSPLRFPTDRYKGYMITPNQLTGANAYRDDFTRSDFSLSTPKILWGWNCDGKGGFGPDCAGILQVTLDIPAGETGRVDYILGQTGSVDEVKEVRARLTPEAIDRACEEQEAVESSRCEQLMVETGNPNYDGLINYFVKKQMVSYIINKSGFRDNLQTDAAMALFDYEMAKDNLIRALASQYSNGCVPHGFRPMNRLTYSDKPGWIFLTVPLLIKESGDFSLLDEVVPYFESDESGTVWDHMLRAMRYMYGDTGKNGLCDQHFADWNDGLEPSEKTGARESIMVTQQLCYGLLEMEELARRRGDAEVEREAHEQFDLFKRRLNDVAWDGDWYIRSTCEVGTPLGTHRDDQAQIFLNTQAWAVLSKTAEVDRARRCMESVDRHIETDIGYLISSPPCTRVDERIGRYSMMPPGHATNGGAYCHAAGFKAVADCMLKRPEEAWRTFKKVAPDSEWNPITVSRTEPFSFTNCYEKVPQVAGQAQYPWRTGTAAWFTMALIEWIFGVRRTYEGLLLDPCMSKELDRVRLVRKFRGATYEISIDNSAGRCVGVTSINVDGEPLEGRLLPVFREGRHTVEVVV